MMEQWGVAMGKEFYDMGANVQLGPGLSTPPLPPPAFPRIPGSSCACTRGPCVSVFKLRVVFLYI